jgi:hypothetical protein
VTRCAAALVALVVGATAACSSGQDPGVTPEPGTGPSTTSQLLQPCPDGGPDDTTPPAGCLDPAGNVLRPEG